SHPDALTFPRHRVTSPPEAHQAEAAKKGRSRMPWDAGLVVGALLGYRSAMTFANLITMGIADPTADAKGLTQQILKKIDETLAAVGSNKSKLLSATVYVANMGVYADMHAAWDAWVDPANTPARATIEARLASPKYLVEIMSVAAI